MKPCNFQFGVRKNPDSQRVHGLRLALNSSSEEQPLGSGNAQAEVRPLSEPRMVEAFQLPLAEKANDATGMGRREPTRLLTVEEVASMLHVPVSWVYGRMRKTALERMPAYRVGKYWRFRAEEVMAWLRDSKRQPGPDQWV
jgi:excisionase family DNA binding protein